ncbi:hypothetical protein PZA11_001602 [Diplocarpon coronariae]
MHDGRSTKSGPCPPASSTGEVRECHAGDAEDVVGRARTRKNRASLDSSSRGRLWADILVHAVFRRMFLIESKGVHSKFMELQEVQNLHI